MFIYCESVMRCLTVEALKNIKAEELTAQHIHDVFKMKTAPEFKDTRRGILINMILGCILNEAIAGKSNLEISIESNLFENEEDIHDIATIIRARGFNVEASRRRPPQTQHSNQEFEFIALKINCDLEESLTL